LPAPSARPARTDNAQTATAVERPKPAAPVPAATPPPPAPRPKRTFATIDEAYDEEKRLWSKAIDAEANQDYVEAVRCYEEIKLLPSEVHPRALEVRLDLARRLMK
jgi:hypothetical protein